MKYSIIIPHHNNSLLLKRCLESIPVRQDVEVIVVDDFSTSDELQKVKELVKSHSANLLQTVRNGGGGYARNFGLKHATGKWILFADSDDFYSEGFLSVLDTVTARNCDVVYFNFNTVDCTSYKEWDVLPDIKHIMSKDNPSDDELKTVRYRCTPPWNKLVRKEFLDKNKIFFEEVPQGNDVFFTLQVAHWGVNYCTIKTPIYNYTKNTKGITRRKWSPEVAERYLRRISRLNSFFSYIRMPQFKRSFIRQFAVTFKKARTLNTLIALYRILTQKRQELDYVKSIKERE